MRKVRWGILSTADIAQKQLIPAIERAENAEVVAIASGSGRAQAVADKFHIEKVYDNYDALLDDPNVDAVYIPLPNHLHKEWVIKAAEKGKHVLCEKPAALDTKETKELVDACRKYNVRFMEAFMYQFHPQHNRVKEIIASGEIGEVQMVEASFSFFMENPEGNIRMDPEKGGGALYDIGCYCIHSIRNILGEEPVSIYAEADIDPKYKVDTGAYVIMTMESGKRATFNCSFTSPMREQYVVKGTKGYITVPRAYRPDNHGHEGLVIVEKGNETRVERIVGDQYKLEVEHFSQAVLDGVDPIYTGEKTIQNMEVIEKCYSIIAKTSK
jgi:D-xylose 1-dehydrogenase (NADP+, D-xylono-1,5-lactone-forming)